MTTSRRAAGNVTRSGPGAGARALLRGFFDDDLAKGPSWGGTAATTLANTHRNGRRRYGAFRFGMRRPLPVRYGAATRISMVNVHPLPSSLSTQMRPPMPSTMPRVMAKPSPDPSPVSVSNEPAW